MGQGLLKNAKKQKIKKTTAVTLYTPNLNWPHHCLRQFIMHTNVLEER